jgi:anti-sigma factor RsiW
MKCRYAAKEVSAYIDGRLDADRQQRLASHIDECRLCAARAAELRQIRRSLRSMPSVPPPPDLPVRLRIIASRERARRVARQSWGSLAAEWWGAFNLWLDNLMYPLALPFAGGVASAIMLFAVLVSGVVPPAMVDGHDVPTVLYTEASVRSTGPLSYTDDVEVEIIVDQRGRVADYFLPPSVMNNAELRRSVESNLIFTQFYPATTFGLPTSGKVKISFRKSLIEVKG